MLGVYLRQLLVQGVVEEAAVIKPGQRVANRVLVRVDILMVRLTVEHKDVDQQHQNQEQGTKRFEKTRLVPGLIEVPGGGD